MTPMRAPVLRISSLSFISHPSLQFFVRFVRKESHRRLAKGGRDMLHDVGTPCASNNFSDLVLRKGTSKLLLEGRLKRGALPLLRALFCFTPGIFCVLL